jgi:glycine/D-amino acid oxidase-like deaminating enzyme
MAPPKLNSTLILAEINAKLLNLCVEKILEELLCAEPTFPSKQPTECYWQSPAHALASIQSIELPRRTDTLVIGSGITGVSVAKHLLEQQDSTQTVTIVDARTLCSGATGRNGGQVVTFGGLYYDKLKQTLGREEASKVLRFERETCEAVYETAKRYAANESEIRKVTRVMAFEVADSMEAMRHSVAEYESDHPDCQNRYKFITGEEARQVSTDDLASR